MSRPSEPMLSWLRKLVEARGLNTAELAQKSELTRSRMRKILIGAEPMLVDELVRISNALEIRPADMGLPGQLDEAAEATAAPDPDALPADGSSPSASEDEVPQVDPWGNHPEQLFKIGFGLGCDFFFLARADELEGCGVPAHILAQYRGGEMPIRLDAKFHFHNAPQYDDGGVTIMLSFDAVTACRFPWTSIKQVIFFPATPEPVAVEPPEDQPPPKPHLRLVT